MYTCNGCGGYLRFDIETQMMKCDRCAALSAVPEEDSRDMQAEYNAKVYTCPSCGGELIGDENEAVVFCSFCGSSNIMTERYANERRPDRIIPFKITKEQCKDAYGKILKKSRFAPKELKDPKNIDSFRAIYMPFYLYDANVDEQVDANGQSSTGITTKTVREYNLKTHVTADFNAIPHDASSSFADDVSEGVLPFEHEGVVEFSPGYLSGFYADTPDVDKDLYKPDIEDMVKKNTSDRIGDIISKDRDDTIVMEAEESIHPQVNDPSIGLFPVWFLSYREKKRVLYAAVNGQTGKVSMDIPMDIKKYFLYTLFVSIPVFIILNLFLTLSPTTTLIFVGIIALLTMILTATMRSELKNKEIGARDKGRIAREGKPEKVPKIWPFNVVLILVAVAAIVILFMFDPVDDVPYYIASSGCILVTALVIILLVRVHNRICTRPLPQFKRTGGDDRA